MNKKWREFFTKEAIGRIAAIGLVTLGLFSLSVAGSIKNNRIAWENRIAAEEKAREMDSSTTENHGTKPRVSPEERPKEDLDASAGQSTLQEQSKEVLLSEEDQKLLDQLSDLLASGNWEGAARILEGLELSWNDFPCMYREGTLRSEVSDGQGLVFIRPFTVFYGEFLNNLPQGTNTALQVMELSEGKRYDYSYGIWDQGKMDGAGECGYNYYDGVSQDITKESVKKGVFGQDFMDGEISYTSVNQEGQSTTWEFLVKEGIIVLDDRWTSKEGGEGEAQYLLLASEDPDHAYTVSESAVNEPRWKNLISYQ